MGQDANEIRREIDATRARMGDTVEALSYKADIPARVKDAVNDRVETVKGTINDVVGGVRESVASTTQRVGNAVGDKLPATSDVRAAARRGVGIAEENPLGLALGALAVGFLVGLLVPVSEMERKKVGPVRDELLERAQNVGSEAIEHGKAVIAETAQAAMKTAQQSTQQHAQQLVDDAPPMGANDFGGPP